MIAPRSLALCAALLLPATGCDSSGGGKPPGTQSLTEYQAKSKATEAEVRLGALGKMLKVAYTERGEFPIGAVGPSPAPGSCCTGPGHRCAPDPALWREPLWEILDFAVEDAGNYSFAYRGAADGQEATAEAIGDLDCDGEPAVFTLRCTSPAGSPTCAITKPARLD